MSIVFMLRKIISSNSLHLFRHYTCLMSPYSQKKQRFSRSFSIIFLMQSSHAIQLVASPLNVHRS